MGSGYPSKDEVLDYLVSSVNLSIWFIWRWLSEHPEEKFKYTFNNRVSILHKTTFNPGHLDAHLDLENIPESAEWLNILNSLEHYYKSARKKHDFSSFEKRSMATLVPLLKGRVDRDIEHLKSDKDTEKYQCGSLRYNLCVDQDNPKRIGFHIANACFPGSMFDDKTYLPACFVVLMNQCEAKFGISEIGTSTWLNSLPKWNALFPDAWQKNMGPASENIQWHYGFWGQFLNSRKTFNHGLAEQFKKTGKMPFLPRTSWCRTSEMRSHLKKFFT